MQVANANLSCAEGARSESHGRDLPPAGASCNARHGHERGRYITGANANTPGYLEIVTELKHRIEAGEIVSKKKAVEWMTSKKSEANFVVED